MNKEYDCPCVGLDGSCVGDCTNKSKKKLLPHKGDWIGDPRAAAIMANQQIIYDKLCELSSNLARRL